MLPPPARWRARAIVLLVVALQTLLSSAAYDYKTYYNDPSKRPELEGAGPGVGMSSLTFVFDRTGSMFDDLDQVRRGTEGIFNTVMKQRQRFIYNYVLVMFHDPEVDEPLITTEPHRFHQKLRHVNLSGGQDCPEMTLTGIKKALEASLPGSFIYVFTDARSKDFHLIDTVLNLIQEKQSSVVFVMTGDCGDRDHEGYKVFDRIASASFGQVFHLQKSQVTQILEYVKHSVSQRKVHLLYEVRETGRSNTNEVPVDSHMSELALSLAITPALEDKFLDLTVIDPKGVEHNIQSFASENETVNLNTVKLIRIHDPSPGVWKVKTSSRNRNTLRVFGHGDIDFKYGFTTIQNPNQQIQLTQPRPFANQNAFLWINITGLSSPGIVERISMVDYEGRETYSARATVARHNPNLYVVGPFLPPKSNSFFFVKVEGVDDKDYKFVRIAPVATSSVEPKGPKASMLPVTPATLYKQVNLTCNVESSTPFEVNWKHNKNYLTTSPLIFQHSDTVTWPITFVTADHAGRYFCEVTSANGNHTSYTDLDMFEPPPEIVLLRNATAVLGEQAIMHCQTQTQVPRFTWFRGGFPVPIGPGTYAHANGSLVIYNTRRIDTGPYTCKVETRGGTANATVFLSIYEKPTAKIAPKDIFVVENSYFQLNCSVTGIPPPKVKWYHMGAPIGGSRDGNFVVDQNNNLRVYSGRTMQGIFECRADNVAGTATDYSNVNTAEKPVINIPLEEYVLGQGDNVVLECQVLRGQPTPKVHWERNGAIFTTEGGGTSKYVYQRYGNLHIRGASEIDAGEYTCVAENIAGRTYHTTKVNIGIAPTVISSPSKVEAIIFKDTSLPCKALGNPVPSIRWFRDGVPLPETSNRFDVELDGTLRIRDVQYNDSGIYVCRATNAYGSQDRSTQVFVVGLEAPVLGTLPPEMQVLETEDVRIDCIVVMGTPQPERIWLKDGKPVIDSLRVFVDGEGSLVIRDATSDDEGAYTCQAKNVVGQTNQNVRVVLMTIPFFEVVEHAPLISKQAGSSIDIPCPVSGHPLPKIVWLNNGHVIDTSTGEFTILKNHTLRIPRLNVVHSGTFSCKAINAAGENVLDTRVTVSTPPVIVPGQTSYNLIIGESLVLPCEVEGEPRPEIVWLQNGKPITHGEVAPDGTLSIDNIDEQHRGEYTCTATNDIGKDESKMLVTVHTIPVIEASDLPTTVVANVNETVILPCPARAVPPPVRVWLYEGQKIEVTEKSKNVVDFPTDGSMVLKAVQLMHEGVYECHVSNLAGEDSVVYSLKVQSPPRIVSNVPGTVDVVLGVGLEIPCRAVGTPAPIVTWQKNGIELISDADIEIDSTGTLRISKPDLDNEGQYRCVARNPAGEDIRVTNVVIQEPPKVMPTQADEFTFIQSETALLKCDVKANPKPTFKWFRNHVEVTPATPRHRIEGDGSTLAVDEVEKADNVVYRCLAENPAGSVDPEMKLNVIVPPEMTDANLVWHETVQINDSFSLYCPVISYPLPQIHWQMNEFPLVEDESEDRVLFSEDRRRLRVLHSRVTDAGVYKCIARNRAGESSKTFEVEVLVPPQRDTSLFQTHISAIEHARVEIGCPVSGIPTPEIKWYVNLVTLAPGESKGGIKVSDDGEKIIIEDALVEHKGTFTCVANSKAGSLPVDVELFVLAPPQVGGNETVHAVLSKTTTLYCDVKNESPKSSIKWLYKGKEVLPPDVQVSPNTKKLVILDTAPVHSGAYECLVRNSAGESRKRFDVDVWEKPTFSSHPASDDLTLIAGTQEVLDCTVEGNPLPVVEWKRDNLPFTEGVSPDGRKLTIQNDSSSRHRYTCVVTNEAGSIFRDFVIQTISRPRLAGTGDGLGDVVVVPVVQGHSTTLECQIESDLSPVDIAWLWDGEPVSDDRQKVTITSDGARMSIADVQIEDEGAVTCVATNVAGEASRTFKLQVIVPPRMDGIEIENVDVIEGGELDLQCLFLAQPPPDVAWTKDGLPLTPIVNLLNGAKSAYIEKTERSDAGSYLCRVSNVAGSTEKTFNVRVIVRPTLLLSNETDEVEVLVDSTYTFDCPIPDDIDPTVEFIWTRDKFPLLQDQLVEFGAVILNNGKRLRILKASKADEGIYACVARNEAGEATKNFKFDVLIPPKILSPQSDFKVIENNSLVLPCEVEGSPLPTIEWTKDNKPATDLADVEILSGGQQFKIVAAQEDHRGNYVCLAKNKVGKIDINFAVDVITRPTIAQSVKDVVEAVEGDKAIFDCEVNDRNFDGEIVWLRDYEPIDGNSPKFTLTKGNRKLIVNNVDTKDESSYSCRVKNDAGTATVSYRLEVLVPPKIIMLDKDKNRTVVENGSLSLSCPATGKPEPKITWFKDGEVLAANNITAKIKAGSIEGNELRISRTMVANGGSFTCEAKNKAGVADQDVQVEIMTPPKIIRENVSSVAEGKLDDHAEIQCFAVGRPIPSVTWLKNGRPLDATRDVYLSSNHMRLHFSQLHKQHVAKYTCIARNPAGEDKRDFSLRLLETPKIDATNIVRSIEANVGGSVEFECPAAGSPEPVITWLRDGLPLPQEKRYVQSNGGRTLRIRDLDMADSGRFTCIAKNNVGTAELGFTLKAIGPPYIAGPSVEGVTVQLNHPKELKCEVDGTPPIEIEWYKSGKPVAAEAGLLQTANQGRSLHIMSAQRGDASRFTCVAKNSAGEQSKHFDLSVHIPPTIMDSTSSPLIQSVIPSTDFKIDCRVDAIPAATIAWYKNGYPLAVDDLTHFANNNQTLYVRRASDEHGGSYTCEATNQVGTATRKYLITLATPPVFDHGTETLDVDVGSHVALKCEITSGTGKIDTHWLFNNRVAPDGNLSQTVSVNGNKILINKVRFSDAGEYTCVARNEAGEAKKIFFINVQEKPKFLDKSNTSIAIIIGRPFTLDCAVQGTPKPTIKWLKNGEVLNNKVCLERGDCQFLADNQRLVIEEAGERDAGRYSCIAENVPGRDEKDIVVSLLRPPVMKTGRVSVEVAEGNAKTLDCPIDDRSINIDWFRDDLPINPNSGAQILNSGRNLHLIDATPTDSGKYSCLATNEAGQDTAQFDVVVLVQPSIIGPTFRTIESVSNQSVPLICRTQGFPPPKIEWFFSDQLINTSDTSLFEIADNGSILHVKNIQAGHGGRYTCVAKNKVGKAEADVFVVVSEPPVILPSPEQIKVIEGGKRVIKCDVTGHPAPEVVWRKNGEPLSDSVTVVSRGGENYIHITKAQVDDAARYTCIATNRAGEKRHNIQLQVLVPPRIVDGERVLNAVEGSKLTLNCLSSGTPAPEIQWFKNGLRLAETQQQLQLPNLTVSDATKYTCKARNEAGSTSADFVVDVFVKPRIKDHSGEVRIIEGAKAKLDCKAEGNPPPTIQWLRGGRPITDTTNLLLSPRGESLMILKTKTTDAGGYSCVAKNVAGETEGVFEVTVLTAPHLVQAVDQNPRIIYKRPVTLRCPVRGNPQPAITWRFNGTDIPHDKEGYTIDNQDLVIAEATDNTGGRYTCHAANEVDFLDTNYELDVMAPPKFAPTGQKDFEVLVNDSIVLTCPLEATPQPEIIWLRGGEPIYLSDNIKISADSRKLTIQRSTLEDNGKYTCNATNVAGTADTDVFLRVLVPPTIDESNIISNPLAVIGKAIYLECPADGIPQPEITWMRNGRPVAAGDKYAFKQNNVTFGILNVHADDAGKYSCVATNKGGRADEDFDLNVLAPPELTTTEIVKITRREGDEVVLVCPVRKPIVIDANEERDIMWTKNGRSLGGTSASMDPKSNGNTFVQISSDGYTLTVSGVQLIDAGDYGCLVTNRAGEAQGRFVIEILSKPVIDTSRNVPESHVISGRPFTFHCPVIGHPLPAIQWFKDGTPINPISDPGLRLIEEGQGLEIFSVDPGHKGQWKCEAENDAGGDSISVKLDVWTSPETKVSPGPEGAIRPLGTNVILICEAGGNPKPHLSWQFDGRILLSTEDGIQITNGNSQLVIPNLRQEDAGNYTCVSKNEVGSDEADIAVNVLIPSKIDKEGLQLSQRLPSGQTLTLFCEVKGKPPPLIRWYANDTLLDASSPNIKIGENANFIQISNITREARGDYRCVANNAAGNDTLVYKVDVDEKPIITNSGTWVVMEGKVAQMHCNATGEPAPKITWLRNGMRLETNVRYIVEKNTLKVVDTRSDTDSGIYLCLAQNEAGSVQQAFTLEVLVSPKVTSASPNETVIAKGDAFSLRCGSIGHPEPAITWEYNDEKVETSLTTTEYRIEDDTLYVKELPVVGTAYFRCVVHNDAGSDEMEFVVKSVAPPTLKEEGPKSLNITEGEPSIFFCDVDADLASSTIIWQKDGQTISQDATAQPAAGGKQLRIQNTLLNDQGTYACTVLNTAGNVTQNTTLHVGAAPKISTDLRRLVVKKGESAELLCEAVGMPPPQVSWLKDNETILAPVEESKATATFHDVQPEQAGVYNCRATNWAGTVYQDVDLVVLIPPEIANDKLNESAHVKDNILLYCNASGIPEPVVSWLKVPDILISEHDEKYQVLGTSLAIKNITLDDDGFYHCIAKSDAGEAIASRKVTVIPPFKSGKLIWVECNEEGEPIESVFKQARGDMPESEKKFEHWATQSNPLNGTDNAIIRCLPTSRSLRNLGGHSIDVPPQFVEEPQSVKVSLGDDLRLRCSAVGPPQPEVVFEKDGTILDYTRSETGAIEIRKIVEEESDAGEYVCIASNDVGVSKVMATVRVVNATVLHGIGAAEEAETPVTVMDCLKDSRKARDHVIWKLDEESVGHLDNSMHALHNGSLAIGYVITQDDADRINCYVNGEPGDGILTSTVYVTDEVPVVKIKPTRIYAEPAEHVVIDCYVKQGNPLTTRIRWSKDNVNLAPDGDKIWIAPNNSLILRHAAYSDRGNFKCRGSNSRGKSWDGVELFVEDAPKHVKSKIGGSVNGKPFGELILAANLTPSSDTNDIEVTIDNLVGDHTKVTKSVLGVVAMPLHVVGYEPSAKADPVRKRPSNFQRTTNYEFESGEFFQVNQSSHGMETEDYNLDVSFDGMVPVGKEHDFVEFEPMHHQFVGDSANRVIGKGSSALKFGAQHRVPFRWSDNIDFEDPEDYDEIAGGVHDADRFVKPGDTLNVDSYPSIDHNNVLHVGTRVGRLERCPEGFTKIRDRCIDVDECKLDVGVCGNGTCFNLPGSYECRVDCAAGFSSSPEGECEDVDECTLGIDDCSIGQECHNTYGSFVCRDACIAGYQSNRDGTECLDVDECLEEPCDAPATCKNLLGTYACICPTGLATLNGSCEGLDVDPEKPLKIMDFAADRARCPVGFWWDKEVCSDIGECEFDAPCAYKCVNLPGSYQCTCPDGYVASQEGACIDIDECQMGDFCDGHEICFNELGTFSCLDRPCPRRYTLNRDSMQCEPNCIDCNDPPINIHMLSIRDGLEGETPLIRLTAHDHDGRVLRKSLFRIRTPTPFFLRADSNSGGSATVYNKYPLEPGSRHQIAIHAISVSSDRSLRFKTDFLVFVSVSQHPF